MSLHLYTLYLYLSLLVAVAMCECNATSRPARHAWVGGLHGVHVSTYDGNLFDCPGCCGEFVLARSDVARNTSLCSTFRLHARVDNASLISDLILSHERAPKVQLSVLNGTYGGVVSGVYNTGRCRLLFTINDTVQLAMPPGTNQNFTSVHVRTTEETATITVAVSAMRVFARVVPDAIAGRCGLFVQHVLPVGSRPAFIRGVLGSPDGNRDNDWMNLEGTFMRYVPQWSDRNALGWDYCTANWRVGTHNIGNTSLLSPLGQDLRELHCAVDRPTQVNADVNTANVTEAQLTAVCHDRLDCRKEGLARGVNGAHDFMTFVNETEDQFAAYGVQSPMCCEADTE